MENEPKITHNKTKEQLREKLLMDIEAAKSDMEAARINFDFVYKPEDADIYIYKLREASSRYEKLFKELKHL